MTAQLKEEINITLQVINEQIPSIIDQEHIAQMEIDSIKQNIVQLYNYLNKYLAITQTEKNSANEIPIQKEQLKDTIREEATTILNKQIIEQENKLLKKLQLLEQELSQTKNHINDIENKSNTSVKKNAPQTTGNTENDLLQKLDKEGFVKEGDEENCIEHNTKNEQDILKLDEEEIKSEEIKNPEIETEEKINNTDTDKTEQSISDDNSLNARFSGEKKMSLAEKLQAIKVSDINQAIGLNERILFQNKLFEGNTDAYKEMITKLNTCGTLQEAEMELNKYIEKYNWSAENEALLKMIEIIEKRY